MAINKKTLLEQAKILNHDNRHNRYTDEEVELALAWVTGEISLTQVARVMSKDKPTNAYPYLACALRQWMNEGKK